MGAERQGVPIVTEPGLIGVAARIREAGILVNAGSALLAAFHAKQPASAEIRPGLTFLVMRLRSLESLGQREGGAYSGSDDGGSTFGGQRHRRCRHQSGRKSTRGGSFARYGLDPD